MFKRLKSVVRDPIRRGSTELFRPFRRLRGRLRRAYYSLRFSPVLRKLIEGQRILIVACGPSVRELKEIPDDVKIFTCKRGIRLFAEKKFERVIDLYLCQGLKIEKHNIAEALLSGVRVKLLVGGINYMKKRKDLKGTYSRLIPYYSVRGLIRRLEKPKEFDWIRREGGKYTNPSSGIRLLLYALYFGAKEIYLSGIDLSTEKYFWGGKDKPKTAHLTFDGSFLRAAAEECGNIYSASKSSPITEYVPYKKLE